MSETSRNNLKLLYLAKGEPGERIWSDVFINNLQRYGHLTLLSGGGKMCDEEVAEHCRQHDILFTDWGSRSLPEQVAEDSGRLRYICALTGSIRSIVPRVYIERGLLVSNWGDSPAHGIAEGAIALLMASLKELVPIRKRIEEDGDWSVPDHKLLGSMRHLPIGVYGLGVIGRQFVRYARVFEPELRAFDPYCAEWPEGVSPMESLRELFRNSSAIVVLAALNEETRGSVDASCLSLLHDGGILVNVARGAVLDQDALFRELESGRLRAALDVLDTNGKDWLPPGHPARKWPNLILTPHKIGASLWNEELAGKTTLSRKHEIALDNIRRFANGERPRFTFDLIRYDRST